MTIAQLHTLRYIQQGAMQDSTTKYRHAGQVWRTTDRRHA